MEGCLKNDNVLGFYNQVARSQGGVLTIGMVDNGMIDDMSATVAYVDYLKEQGVVEFISGMENGSLMLVTDVAGNEFITEKNSRLFFTNLCLGYRNRGFSEGFKRKWITDDMKYFMSQENDDLFSPLLDIIKPDNVLCLGLEVYNALRKGFKREILPGQSFYEQLDSGENWFEEPYKGEKIKVFGLAHPGNMGTANRYTKCTKNKEGKNGKDLQKEDWNNVAEIINSQSKNN